jgi:hypothetical protein
MTTEMLNEDFDVNAASEGFGSTNKEYLRVSKKVYETKTAQDMLDAIVIRIDETIKAIDEFDSWDKPIKAAPLKSPMATRELGGFTVKLGTGAKNEDFGIALKCFKMNRDGDDRVLAISWLEQMKIWIEEGKLNGLAHKKLTEYRKRAELGKVARKLNKIQPEKENNITELNAA